MYSASFNLLFIYLFKTKLLWSFEIILFERISLIKSRNGEKKNPSIYCSFIHVLVITFFADLIFREFEASNVSISSGCCQILAVWREHHVARFGYIVYCLGLLQGSIALIDCVQMNLFVLFQIIKYVNLLNYGSAL